MTVSFFVVKSAKTRGQSVLFRHRGGSLRWIFVRRRSGTHRLSHHSASTATACRSDASQQHDILLGRMKELPRRRQVPGPRPVNFIDNSLPIDLWICIPHIPSHARYCTSPFLTANGRYLFTWLKIVVYNSVFRIVVSRFNDHAKTRLHGTNWTALNLTRTAASNWVYFSSCHLNVSSTGRPRSPRL